MAGRKKADSVAAGRDIASRITLQCMVLPAIILVIIVSCFPIHGILDLSYPGM